MESVVLITRAIRRKFVFWGLAALLGSAEAAVEIKAPPGWGTQYNMPRGVVFQSYAPDLTAGFRCNMVVTQAKLPCCKEEDTPLDSLFAKVAQQQARVLPLYKVLEKQERRIGGRKGYFMVSSYAQGEKDVACLQFFYLEGENFLNVVYTCLLGDLPKLRPEFEKSLMTFRDGLDATRKNPGK